ncbi:MAG: methyltransferase domain-containing protein [Armatimonadetes bacterium]|nr:methyltransferase domain-containing protein [Armatimonadota bacterium]
MARERSETTSWDVNPGNYGLRRGALLQELRSVARPLKRGDMVGMLHSFRAASVNLWNHHMHTRSLFRFLCPCCGHAAYAFVHLSDHSGVTWNAACPVCDSRSRHRGLALLIPRILNERPGIERAIHFAPEEVLAEVLLSSAQIDYRTTDLTDSGCDFPGEDIQGLSFLDGEFDLVLCNQVLEHVPDDGAAMAELSRILSPRGLAIITVPCDWQRPTTTSFRRVRPGGHFRHYGRDLADRLAQRFESVVVLDMHELDSARDGLRYGIPPGDVVFLCSKQASRGSGL